jgi:hypothetical protein
MLTGRQAQYTNQGGNGSKELSPCHHALHRFRCLADQRTFRTVERQVAVTGGHTIGLETHTLVPSAMVLQAVM